MESFFIFAGIFGKRFYEIAALFASIVTLIGVRLRWRLAWHFSEAEEAAKNDKITPEQARHRIRFLTWFCPSLIVTGLSLFLVAAVEIYTEF